MRIVCFTGRISRIINCLCGFYDDIFVNISIVQQIDAKYNIVIKQFLEYKDNIIKYNILCRYTLEKLLVEIDVDKDTIDAWINPFIDIIIDECDVIVLQNSNLYFSSTDFVNRLENRKPNKQKLLVYQLWNCLPDEYNDYYEVFSLSNFRYLQNRKRLP